MVIQANVCAVGQVQKGTSQHTGNEWRKQEFVVEWFINPNDTQSQKIVLSLMNDRIEQYNLKVGDKVEVRFDLRFREYQGRFYQDVFMPYDGLLKISNVENPVAPLQTEQREQQPTPKQQPQEPKEKADDLPF